MTLYAHYVQVLFDSIGLAPALLHDNLPEDHSSYHNVSVSLQCMHVTTHNSVEIHTYHREMHLYSQLGGLGLSLICLMRVTIP